MQNQTKAIFANLQSSFEEVQSDQGLGSLGEWPARGQHNCYVLNMTITDNATFKEAQAAGGHEHDAISIQFGYQLVEDPDRAEPLEWRGAPITIPQNPGAIQHEGSQICARIELQRLKGHIKTLLGREPGDLQADMDMISQMLSGDQSVVAVVDCRYNERGGRTYKTEYLQSLLGG